MRGAIHLMQYADFYLTYYKLSALKYDECSWMIQLVAACESGSQAAILASAVMARRRVADPVRRRIGAAKPDCGKGIDVIHHLMHDSFVVDG